MSLLAILPLVLAVDAGAADDDFLQWNGKHAKAMSLAMRVHGQVGRSLDLRVVGTDRAYNYKLRATWMTPDVIRAVARLQQLAKLLTERETQQLVREAEAAGEIIIQIEIDPREGSGIIPDGWVAVLGPPDSSGTLARSVRGISRPGLRDLPALAGGAPRDYSYEMFWVVFPRRREDGQPVFSAVDKEAQLTVAIHGKIGKVRWPAPEYLQVKP